ncbi:MAG: virulence factor [Thiothrix sp.]|nr:virulence factor [Thiothrix sp.]
MPQKIIVYWRDIPSQVTIQQGRTKGKWLMSQRFQEAIDRAAIRAGKADTDSYVAEWRRETSDYACDGELEACARAEVALLEAAFPEALLNRMVNNGGLTPDRQGA